MLYFRDLTQIGFVQALLGFGQNLNILSVVVVNRHILLLLLLLRFKAATSLALLDLLACHLFCRVLIQTLDLHVSLIASQSLLILAASCRVDSFLARVGALSDERVGSSSSSSVLLVLLLGAVGQGVRQRA